MKKISHQKIKQCEAFNRVRIKCFVSWAAHTQNAILVSLLLSFSHSN